MKTLMLGCLGVLILSILSLGACGYFLLQAADSQPPDAKREVLFAANRSLIERIDLAIRESPTLAACSERLRGEVTDPKVIWLHLSEPGSRQQIETIKRESWTGNSTMVFNGAGSGTLIGKFGTQEIRIIQSQERSTSGPVFEYIIYLAVAEPAGQLVPPQPLTPVDMQLPEQPREAAP